MSLMSWERLHGYGPVLRCIENGLCCLFAINVIPAIQTNQFALLTKDSLPVAFCTLAGLNMECEVKYINDVTSLYAKDWISGERKWFIDWIAPFGHNMDLYKHMRKKYPYELFRAIRLDEYGKTGKIAASLVWWGDR